MLPPAVLFITPNQFDIINFQNTYLMKQPKKNYSAPSADLLVVRFEQNIMSGGAFSSTTGAAGSILDIDDEEAL